MNKKEVLTQVSEKSEITIDVCEKVLTAFKEVFDKELSDKLKFWK